MLEAVCSVKVIFSAEHNGFNRYYASRQGVRLIGPIAFEQLVHRLINVINRSKIILPITTIKTYKCLILKCSDLLRHVRLTCTRNFSLIFRQRKSTLFILHLKGLRYISVVKIISCIFS